MKILAEVITPGNGKTYEFIIDDKLTVGSVKEKLIEEITAFENGLIDFDGQNAALYSTALQTRLPDSRNLRKAGFRSGEKLILV